MVPTRVSVTTSPGGVPTSRSAQRIEPSSLNWNLLYEYPVDGSWPAQSQSSSQLAARDGNVKARNSIVANTKSELVMLLRLRKRSPLIVGWDSAVPAVFSGAPLCACACILVHLSVRSWQPGYLANSNEFVGPWLCVPFSRMVCPCRLSSFL